MTGALFPKLIGWDTNPGDFKKIRNEKEPTLERAESLIIINDCFSKPIKFKSRN